VETCNISGTGQDNIIKVTIDLHLCNFQEVAYALSTGTEINDICNDLEPPLRTVFQNTRVFRDPPSRQFE